MQNWIMRQNYLRTGTIPANRDPFYPDEYHREDCLGAMGFDSAEEAAQAYEKGRESIEHRD